eukprot:6392335-Pyramimonas_sp.AAC.1
MGGARMGTLPQQPSAVLPVSHGACDGCADIGGEARVNPTTGAFGEKLPVGPRGVRGGCADMGWETHPNPAILWGHETCAGCA